MEKRQPTQKDIAEIAGVNRASVSMALNSHPSIPQKTRDRILKIAAEIGYSPNPMLSALAAYRNRIRPASFQGTIAWLANSPKSNPWLQNPHFRLYYEGACEQAKLRGFQIEIFHLQEPAMSTRRIASIFHNRNINCILLGPQAYANVEIVFPFEHFAAVAFGYSLAKPALHSVATAHFQSAVQTIQKLKEYGYQRIAYTVSPTQDQKVNYQCLGGYLVDQFIAHDSVVIPPVEIEYDPSLFKRWFKKYKPDAIVTGNVRILSLLEKVGLRAPDDVGVACPCLPSANSEVSGMSEDAYHIGKVAVDTLVSIMLSGERGIPQIPRKTLVNGTWTEGRTITCRETRKALCS